MQREISVEVRWRIGYDMCVHVRACFMLRRWWVVEYCFFSLLTLYFLFGMLYSARRLFKQQSRI